MTPAILTQGNFDAVLFDLDGVVTATAKVHAACWKRMFDAFLTEYCAETSHVFIPFDIVADYGRYVDGKLRQDGVKSFLQSRGIDLPEESSDTAKDQPTIAELGRRKDALFVEGLRQNGVETMADGMALVRQVRAAGLKTAVVSSSKNCLAVLQAAGIEDFFAVRVDGVTVERLHLAGKPAPDGFLKAAELLGVAPHRCVVVEDAISGVQAGRRGHFGLVVGVARKGDADELLRNGAHIVVSDLKSLIV